MFKFSQRSLNRLEGVKPELVAVANRAIEITTVDFGITEGLRTVERQKQLVAQGRSQTMKSRHITGDAVDVAAYMNGEVCWELAVYDNIADAFAQAGRELGVGVLWGAAWTVTDITKFDGTMEDAMNSYIDLRRSQGRRPFIDGPHFQLA